VLAPQIGTFAERAGSVTAQSCSTRTRRPSRPACILSAPKLQRWLVGSGFAELDGEVLRPTKLSKSIGGSLRRLDGV
jgi:hypothetical protein